MLLLIPGLFLVSTFLTDTASAQEGMLLSVKPANSSIPQNSTTTIEIVVSGGVNLTAFDLTVSYNPAIVTLESWSFGSYLSNLAEVYRQDKPGTFQLAATQLATPGVTGDGVLLLLVFRGANMGESLISITQAEFATADIQLVIPELNDAEISVSKPLPTIAFTSTPPPTRTATTSQNATHTATLTATRTSTPIPSHTATSSIFRTSTPSPSRTSAYISPKLPSGMVTNTSISNSNQLAKSATPNAAQEDNTSPQLPQKRITIPSAGGFQTETTAEHDSPQARSTDESANVNDVHSGEQADLASKDQSGLYLVNTLLWSALVILALMLLVFIILILKRRKGG